MYDNVLRSLLGCSANSSKFRAYLLSQHTIASLPAPESYPDAVYFSLPDQGVSYVFEPISPYKPKYKDSLATLALDQLTLTAIDIYAKSASKTQTAFFKSSLLPLTFSCENFDAGVIKKGIVLDVNTTGKELVDALSEPERKGGGAGSIPIWLEWTRVGIKIEMGNSLLSRFYFNM